LAVLLVLGARAVVEGDEGVTVVSLEDILERRVGGKVNALEVPVVTDPARGVVLGAARVSRTPADEPIVAAIAGVQLDGEVVKDARIALTGVWPEAVGLADAAARLVGGRLDDARLGSVAAAVQREVSPPSDYLGSAEYRRAMAGVTTRRALQRCCEQVGGAT